MTSVWNNSNANSAIVNTILASPSVQNPSIYSTKEIVPPHAITYTTIQHSGGLAAQAVSNGSFSFQLSKFGIAEQILLTYQKSTTALSSAAAGTVSFGMKPGDIFKCIQRIDLLSSSRVVSSLTNETLVAMFSDLTSSQLEPMCVAGSGTRAPAPLPTAAQVLAGTGPFTPVIEYAIPLVFPLLSEVNTQLNTTFLEPMTIQVHWGDVSGISGTAAVAASEPAANLPAVSFLNNCTLKVRYKNYPEESTSQILASNFAQPELNMLSSTYYQENTVTYEVPAAGVVPGNTASVTIDLRNTDAVTDFYAVVRRTANSAGVDVDTTPDQAPLDVARIRLTGSGQEICDLSAAQLEYAKICNNGFSLSSRWQTTSAYDYETVAKFQCGSYDDSQAGHNPMSNCLSLREVNAPQMQVFFVIPPGAVATDTYTITIVEKCLAIYAISSATGRMTLALSN